MDTRLVHLGEEPKPWRRPESLAGLFVPAMAWLLALVGLVLEGRRCHRGARSNLSPSMTSCKQTTIFLCNSGLANHIGRRWLQRKSKTGLHNVHGPDRHVASYPVDVQSIARVEVRLHLSESPDNSPTIQSIHLTVPAQTRTTALHHNSVPVQQLLRMMVAVLQAVVANHSAQAVTMRAPPSPRYQAMAEAGIIGGSLRASHGLAPRTS